MLVLVKVLPTAFLKELAERILNMEICLLTKLKVAHRVVLSSGVVQQAKGWAHN